ncbi:kinase-like domain-containing protein [Pelagophyceae sp. CCMP2097]|nr:kinase-like domain-containing protein [Pelagophyceae sp. CCMP2097]
MGGRDDDERRRRRSRSRSQDRDRKRRRDDDDRRRRRDDDDAQNRRRAGDRGAGYDRAGRADDGGRGAKASGREASGRDRELVGRDRRRDDEAKARRRASSDAFEEGEAGQEAGLDEAGDGDEALDDDEEALAIAAAQRKAKRAEIMQRHKEKVAEAPAVAVDAAVVAADAVAVSEPAAAAPDADVKAGLPEVKAAVEPEKDDDATLRFKRTKMGLAEERKTITSFDMFGDAAAPAVEDDAATAAARLRTGRRATAAQLLADELGEMEQANWDDQEGYYMARPGEIIAEKYRVLGVVGRGVFSSVLRAVEVCDENVYVAVKMIRNNEIMSKASLKEIELLHEIAKADPDQRAHCVALKDHTEHRNHTALVFESMSMNLREALRKFGKNVGINISAVKSYSKQLLLALRHLGKLRIVHADIKPDNILVSEGNAVLKLCDFGSAFREHDANCSDPSPYLVSRFYRAPEIILGLKFDTRVDLWSVASCLYELYTGHIMFNGVDNNNMLRVMMELKGRFPVKMLKAHVRSYQDLLLLDPHFHEVGSTFKFQHRVIDERTSEPRLALVDIVKPTRSISGIFLEKKAGADDRRSVVDLADLLEQACALNPEHRPCIMDCLKHKFVVGRPDVAAENKAKAAAKA